MLRRSKCWKAQNKCGEINSPKYVRTAALARTTKLMRSGLSTETMNAANDTVLPGAPGVVMQRVVSTPRPYYQQDGITLYHGNNRTILPTLDFGMVVITDQPYGTGWVRGGGDVGKFRAKHEKPEWDEWSLDWLPLVNRPKRVAAFCPVGKCEEMCNALPMPMVLHYCKTNVRPGGMDREPIVVSPPVTPKVWKKAAYNGDMPLHPCQKPLDVMLWLVESVTEEGDVILDPFAGSGTTLLAAKLRGRKAIGIELDEQYCKAAAHRCSQGVLLAC